MITLGILVAFLLVAFERQAEETICDQRFIAGCGGWRRVVVSWKREQRGWLIWAALRPSMSARAAHPKLAAGKLAERMAP